LRLETVGDEHDPSDPVSALAAIHRAEKENKHVTGLLYYDDSMQTADESLGLTETPLSALSEHELRPSADALDKINSEFRGN